jgi:hypothetical protein
MVQCGSNEAEELVSDMSLYLNKLRNYGLAVRMIVIGAASLAVFSAAGPAAFCLGGWCAVAAAGTAGTLCLVGAVIALISSHLLRGPQLAPAALLTGMAARMGVPLCLGMALHLQGGPLADAGLLYYLLVFYPVTLTVETVLSLPQFQRPACPVPNPSSSNTAQ